MRQGAMTRRSVQCGLGLTALLVSGCGATATSSSSASSSQPLVVTWSAGDWGNCQQASFYDTFTKSTGIGVLHGPQLTDGQIRAEVQAHVYNVDLVYPSEALALSGSSDLTPIDYSKIDKSQLYPGTYTPYAVGMDVYAWAMGYRTDKFGGAVPNSWADFFNVQKFPGKRALNDTDVPALMYMALMADGVSPNQLTTIDVQRAINKLNSIKSDIVWYETGTAGQQLLASGEVSMAEIYANRIIASKAAGSPVDISWNGQVAVVDFIAIPKGDPNAADTMKLIEWATSKNINGTAAKCGAGLGPTNSASPVDATVAADLPSSHFNLPHVVESDPAVAAYAVANNDALQTAFNNWKTS
jgi:putative spermidine/putrescine transport system substrate-binding protein